MMPVHTRSTRAFDFEGNEVQAPKAGSLPLDRSERFALIRGAHFSLNDVSPQALRGVRKLLEQIEVLTGRTPCCARVEVLAERLEVADRTVRRWRSYAEAMGVLIVNRNGADGGQGPCEYVIDWQRMLRLQQSPEVEPSEHLQRGHSVRAPGHDDSAPGHHVSAPGHGVRAHNKEFIPHESSIIKSHDHEVLKSDQDEPDGRTIAVGDGRDMLHLDAADFRTERLRGTFARFVAAGFLRDGDNDWMQFLTLLEAVQRRRKAGLIANPFAYLRSVLTKGNDAWRGLATQVDEDRAASMRRKIEALE